MSEHHIFCPSATVREDVNCLCYELGISYEEGEAEAWIAAHDAETYQRARIDAARDVYQYIDTNARLVGALTFEAKMALAPLFDAAARGEGTE